MARKKENNQNKLGIYIHVPFCVAKCSYCDFNSYASKDDQVGVYFKALLDEIAIAGENAVTKTKSKTKNILKLAEVGSIFIGGGTPSLVAPRYIEQVLATIRENFTIVEGAEITIETNPRTLTMEKLCIYRKNGINRISIGLQAAQSHLLVKLGRIHSFEGFVESYRMARLAGFDNINVDLIFGIPDQRMEDWQDTLKKVIDLKPEHISSYSLKIEEGTHFGDLYNRNEIDYIDEDLERQMYYFANEYLAKKGYKHYEISNYGKKDHECRHNLLYWKGEEYLGFGAGAHSYYKGVRYGNCKVIEQYIEAVESGEGLITDMTEISKAESIDEFMMLGLRLVDGVFQAEFKSRFGSDMFEKYGDKIEALSQKGLLESNGKCIRLSTKGLDLANQVFMEFV